MLLPSAGNETIYEDRISYDVKGRLIVRTAFGIEYLSKRESEILKYILQGHSAKKVGLVLGLSFRTVESVEDPLVVMMAFLKIRS